VRSVPQQPGGRYRCQKSLFEGLLQGGAHPSNAVDDEYVVDAKVEVISFGPAASARLPGGFAVHGATSFAHS
jgi:hypothetical protein